MKVRKYVVSTALTGVGISEVVKFSEAERKRIATAFMLGAIGPEGEYFCIPSHVPSTGMCQRQKEARTPEQHARGFQEALETLGFETNGDWGAEMPHYAESLHNAMNKIADELVNLGSEEYAGRLRHSEHDRAFCDMVMYHIAYPRTPGATSDEIRHFISLYHDAWGF